MSASVAPLTTSAAESLQLVCSEVWGGNRSIFLPVELPGLRGALYSHPCDGGRGGDVHYLSVCGSGLLSRICIADVAGHGQTIAQVSDELHRLLRRYMNQPDQRRVLADLNRQLEASEVGALTTAAAITYYPPRGSLSVSYAGHPPAWLYQADLRRWQPVQICRDDAGLFDMPLAVSPETQYSRHSQRVTCGDRLLVLTDGVLEAPSQSGELFGEQRLADLLQKAEGDQPQTVVEKLLGSLYDFTGDATLKHDDVTLLLVEFVPGPGGPAPWLAVKNRLIRPRGNGARIYAAD